MKMQVVTTITTLIDIDTFNTEHSVVVEPEAGVPESIARATAIGACRATLNTLEPAGSDEADETDEPGPYRDEMFER